jgi:hypothetical protein
MDEDQYIESYWEADMFGNPYLQPDQEEDDSFYRGMDSEEEDEEEDEEEESYQQEFGFSEYNDY